MSACTFTEPNDPLHCWHWTGVTIRRNTFDFRDGMTFIKPTEPREERACCHCGRVGLAHAVAGPGHGKFAPAERGEAANDGEFVA